LELIKLKQSEERERRFDTLLTCALISLMSLVITCEIKLIRVHICAGILCVYYWENFSDVTKLFHPLPKLCGIQLSRTTAHHLAANRLVEHFHRTLKTAIMCHADQHWTGTLLVLLGIRTAFKADLQASVAELVFGEPLRIRGKLLTPVAHPVEPEHLIAQLRHHMARLRPFFSNTPR
jgi:hypothetical protein